MTPSWQTHLYGPRARIVAPTATLALAREELAVACRRNEINPTTGRRQRCVCPACHERQQQLHDLEWVLAVVTGFAIAIGRRPAQLVDQAGGAGVHAAVAVQLVSTEISCLACAWLGERSCASLLGEADVVAEAADAFVGTVMPGWLDCWLVDHGGDDLEFADAVVSAAVRAIDPFGRPCPPVDRARWLEVQHRLALIPHQPPPPTTERDGGGVEPSSSDSADQ